MDVAVIGGGLAGLVAALDLARSGQSVTLFEKSKVLGGRARTRCIDEFHFNLGPHALYRGGAAFRALREHGVPVRGTVASANGSYAIREGVAHTLPVGFASLLTTGLLSLPAKLQIGRFFAALARYDLEPLRGLSVADWAEKELFHPEAREFLAAVLRLATYAHDPRRQSAEAALGQLRLAERGVLYLDGGWQSLVDGLAERAREAGVRIEASAPVSAVEHDHAVSGVRLADGSFRAASSVVLSTSPSEAAALAPGAHVLARWADEAIPVRAASLDLALADLPRPHALFGLGIDEPLYFSVHSRAARLAPENGALVHVARYLGSAAPADPVGVEAGLESVLDLLQPGWRPRVLHRRFLPNLVVSNALHTQSGRPRPEVPGVSGLYVSGDWVGQDGMLADASVASARSAAAAITGRPLLPAPGRPAAAERVSA